MGHCMTTRRARNTPRQLGTLVMQIGATFRSTLKLVLGGIPHDTRDAGDGLVWSGSPDRLLPGDCTTEREGDGRNPGPHLRACEGPAAAKFQLPLVASGLQVVASGCKWLQMAKPYEANWPSRVASPESTSARHPALLLAYTGACCSWETFGLGSATERNFAVTRLRIQETALS